ncbi:MAG: hypothetical protein H6558_05610 [Lewinellaceae bacterium]|nr:hypothetical protein [Lewinellaceae bacterium]
MLRTSGGGTPEQEQEWNNPRNWSQNHLLPDIDDIVLIPIRNPEVASVGDQ